MKDKLKVLRYYLYYKKKNRFKNKEELEKFQQKAIEKHLKFVTENSKFYFKYKGKSLKDFPIVDKKIMMDNFNEFNTVGVDKEEALDFAMDSEKTREFNSKLNNITVGLSSGTSNSRGVFLVNNDEKNKWAGYILAKFLPGNIFKKYSVAFFMRANSNLYESVKSKNIQFHFFDIYVDMKENIEKLKEIQPDIIAGQPSVLLLIANEVRAGKLNINPKVVISIAEVLEKSDEEYIKKILNQKVIHQAYQCTEGCLACTCEYGSIHLNEDIVYIEKEYLDEKRFIPIITDFTRTSQPIIRYRLNDILVERKEKCKCGLSYTVLEKIEGREDDIFIFEGNEEEYVYVFPDFVRRCILFAGNINDYRVVQNEDKTIEIYVDVSEEMKDKISVEFEKLAENKKFNLPKIEYHSYFYDKGRKLKRVESLVNGGKIQYEKN